VASVELKGLSKHYGNAVAVDGVSLRVEHGQLVCLLGPSGCGKTTTLRLIAGFIEPSAGEIVVGGKVLSSPARTVPPEGRNMSMIFQSYALWPHMTVAQNVAYGLELRKVARATIREKLATILETTHLLQLADRYPGELSGGQQQRVALARALIVEPETLLLDEPLSNLDANLREEMRFEVRRLHDEYRYTTVYVTHDQAEALALSHEIAVMNEGVIMQVGSPREIYERPRSRFVADFIGRTNLLEAKVAAADGDGHYRLGTALGELHAISADSLRVGDAVSISIRPEDIELSEQRPQGPNVCAGTVSVKVFLGDTVDFQVNIGEQTLLATGHPSLRTPVGDPIFLSISTEKCVALAGDKA